jgi:type II secretory pathway pseudopilin PulG
MSDRGGGAAGFSLVEVVLAMLLLGLIAVALLPALWQGIQLSSEQSTVATATRQLNGLIEEARDSPSCGTLDGVAAAQSFTDGRGATFTTGAQVGYSCTAGTLVHIKLTARNSSGTPLADVTAKIFAE